MNSPSDDLVLARHIDYPSAEAVFGGILDTLCPALREARFKHIVIKINLCEFRHYDSGATTDPNLLAALVRCLRQRAPTCPVLIAENDATSVDADVAFRYMGIDQVAQQEGATLCNFARQEWTPYVLKTWRWRQQIEMPALLGPETLYINFAKLKINSASMMTGCLKNNYALVREKRKVQFHPVLSDVIHDVNTCIAQTGATLLCLVDGYLAMETIGGPAFGRPRKCELLLAGTNPVAVDACAARVMGLSPRRIEHLRLCARAGLGRLSFRIDNEIGPRLFRDYHFRFEGFQYWLRAVLRRKVGMGA